MAHAQPVPYKEHFVNKIERITGALCPRTLAKVLLPSQACLHDGRYLVNNFSTRFGCIEEESLSEMHR